MPLITSLTLFVAGSITLMWVPPLLVTYTRDVAATKGTAANSIPSSTHTSLRPRKSLFIVVKLIVRRRSLPFGAESRTARARSQATQRGELLDGSVREN